MVTLVLRRGRPLSMPEIGRLPPGCVAVQGDTDVVARARPDVSLERLLNMAVRMARAVPDSRFDAIVEDEPTQSDDPAAVQAAPIPAGPEPALPVAAEGAASDEDSGVDPLPTPWQLVADGKIDEALALVDGVPLDSDGRDRVRGMILSTDPKLIALGCRLARATGWRSSVQMIRRIVHHGDTEVRRRAAQAIGDLAGPGMVPLIQPLLQDSSPEIRQVAAVAIATMEGHQG